MTLGEMGDLASRGRLKGFEVRLYDYARNRWVSADEATLGGRDPGVYEMAVFRDRRGRVVRARILPEGRGALRIDAASAGEPAVWAAVGVRLSGTAPRAIARAVGGRVGPVTAAELDAALEALERSGGEGAEGASQARRALAPLLAASGGGGGGGCGRGGGARRRGRGRP